MLRLVRALFLMAVALHTLTQPATAQRPHRSGFWIELAGGPSHIRVACTECDAVSRHSASGGYLRLGGAISGHVLMGIEAYGLADETFGFDETDESIVAENSGLAAVTLWYPWRVGVFVKGGVGVAFGDFTVTTETDEQVRTRGTGVGMTFGLGYDLPVWRDLAITAGATAWVAAIGDVVLPHLRVDDVIATMYSATIGVAVR